ncbi:MAG: RNA pseudouridine synthase [Gammaproteobacteria bacterium]|nr:RNA pseudouridine synthase [Gammaproteobacteria bacterium]MBQ0773910.1 RNA pseudouridine synthase [Gammaproteobacteria bacterium]
MTEEHNKNNLAPAGLTSENPAPEKLDAPYYIVPVCHENVHILHQDNSLLVIVKPAFLLSVPGRGIENSDCVISRLRRDYDEVHLIHRLDLDTSGVMVFARTQVAQAAISRAFQERRVFKQYDAIVEGLVTNDEGEIDFPLAPDWQNRPRQKVCSEKGKSALTKYKVIHRDPQRHCTHLLLTPITGRSHQLRIHCRELGHAIIGCDLYAPDDICARSERLLLHARSLAFNHPTTGLWHRYESAAAFPPQWFDPAI